MLLKVVAFALLPVLSALVGAAIAAFRPPSPKVRSYIQHLAGGVVFSVVAVELLPDITEKHTPLEVAVGFALGVLVMLGIRSLGASAEGKAEHAGNSLGLLVGIGVDVLLDGLLIGISFAAGSREGVLLTFALTVELLSLGLAVSSTLGKKGVKRSKIMLTALPLFSLIAVGAGVGALLIPHLNGSALEILLSFGLAALLYLVTEETAR